MSIVQMVAFVAAAAVVVMGLCALNRMSSDTAHGVRFAFLGLVVAASAAALAPLYGDPPPSWADALVLVAAAAVLGVNKRRTYLVQPRSSA